MDSYLEMLEVGGGAEATGVVQGMDEHDSAGADQKRSPLIAAGVQRLLLEAGIKRVRQVSYIAEVLGLNGRTARRKIHGETSFSEDELVKLLDSVGFEYLGLGGVRKKGEGERRIAERGGDESIYEVMGQFEGQSMKCKVMVKEGRMSSPAAAGKVLAVGLHGEMSIKGAQEVGEGERAMLIESVWIERPFNYEGSGSKVIVLDEEESGEGMAEALFKAGFRTSHVGCIEEMRGAIEAEKPRAVLATWAHWSKWTPGELGAVIKEASPSTLIVFCAAIEDGENEELLDAAAAYGAEIIQQPAKSLFIARMIAIKLRQRH